MPARRGRQARAPQSRDGASPEARDRGDEAPLPESRDRADEAPLPESRDRADEAPLPETRDRRGATGRAAAACADLATLGEAIARCRACARLVAHREREAASPPRRFQGERYWARAVPGFGDPAARILIVGLAPAAHGANRTGRLFTGDRSGDFLYAGLHRVGLASQAESRHKGDGLTLRGVYITAAARCAPPDNAPAPAELHNCRPYLLRELALLAQVRVALALGQIGHDAYLRALGGAARPLAPRSAGALRFQHGALHEVPGAPPLLDCYHVSQQNTFTGRLTPAMLDDVLRKAKGLAGLP